MKTPLANSNPIDTRDGLTYNQDNVDRLISMAVSQAISQYASQRANLENATESYLSLPGKEKGTMPSKYRERVKIGTSDSGTPIYAWACANTKEALHNEIARLLSGGHIQTSSPANPVSWEAVADEWFNVFHRPKIRENTLAKDMSLFVRHVRPAFEGAPIQRITATDIQRCLEQKSKYCKSQVRDIMSMMKQIFALAIDKDYITKNPMYSTLVFNPSKKPDRPRQSIPQECQTDIINHLEDLRFVYDRNGDNMNALRFMAFLMYTGLRPCEIYGLRWEDIDQDRMMISISRDLVFVSGKGILGAPKTPESIREIPIDHELLRLISPVQSSGFIIHMTDKGREDEHFTEQAARNMWLRIKKHIDVHGMTPYMGRHTYATNMNKANVPIKTAMSIMGHKDERMLLRRYTHTDQEDLTKAANSVSALINKMTS